MAFPLKSGADLYNNQLIRAAIWNYSADIIEPSELVTGLIYFNTSNSSAGKKLRLYTGTEWKTIAFEEDLDVANNAEFKALEDKVKLLSGEVDTDAIINNMKEVSNFLAGFAEDAKLMDVLNNKLDKSNNAYYGLDFNSTGTDGASRMVLKNNNNVLVGFGHNGTVAYLSNYLTSADIQIGDTITVKEKASTNRYDLLHSGNVKNVNGIFVSRDVLTSNNDLNTLLDVGAYSTQSSINQPTDFAGWYGDLINYRFPDSTNWQLFTTNTLNTSLLFRKQCGGTWSDWKTIAFTDSNVASATKLKTPRTIWGQSFDGTGDVSGDLALFQSGIYWHRDKANYCIETEIHDNASPSLKIAHYGGISFYTKGEQKMLINNSGNVTIGASDLAGTSATAKLYVDGYVTTKDGVVINAADAYNSYWEKGFLFSSNSALNAGLWGYGYKSLEYLYLGFGNYSAAVGIRINENGNVLIGTTEDNGDKLQVKGGAAFAGGRVRIPVNGDRITFNAESGNGMGILAMNLNNTYLEAPITDAGDKTPIFIGWRDGSYALAIAKTGYVGIGVPAPQAQLHVAQDIVANGTIACKGIAAEGSEVGMGTVDKKVLFIPSSTTQQTFSLTHGLNTREITVCVFEITSTGTNMILTDVEITGDNTISVSFGNPPTDNHMVVVMG